MTEIAMIGRLAAALLLVSALMAAFPIAHSLQ